MLSKVIRYLYYSLFFVTPLLMYSKTSEIFEFNKMIFIYLISILITGIWSVKYILQQNKTLSITYLHWIVLAFIGTQMISTLVSIDQHTSFFGYYGRFNGGLFSLILFSFLFFVLSQEATLSFVKRLLFTSLLSSFIVMMWGLPGKFGYDLTCGLFTGTFTNGCWTTQFQPSERMFSTLGQPNWLGAYLAVQFFLGFFFFLQKSISFKNNRIAIYDLLWGGYLILTFIFILFTKSRSALLSVLIGLVLLPIFLVVKNKEYLKSQILRKCAVLMIFLVVPILIFKTGVAKVDKFITLPKTEVQVVQPAAVQQNLNITDSFDIRKVVWKGAIALGLKYPFFGTGVETFAYSYYFTRPVDHNTTSEWDFLYNKAHNEYLNYFATTGFVGAVGYLLMIIAVFMVFIRKLSIKKQTEESILLYIVILTAYSTILVTNFFGFSTSTISLFFYILPALLLFKTTEIEEKPTLNGSIKQKAGVVAISIVVFYGCIFVLQYWYADTRYSIADSNFKAGNYATASSQLINILKYHYEHVYEDKLALASVGTALNTEDKEEAQKLIELSNYMNEKTLIASPYNILYWRSRGNIMYNIYQITSDKVYLEKALAASLNAEKLGPTDPRLPYSAALYSLQLYEIDKDKKAYYSKLIDTKTKRAIALKSNYYEAYVLKATYLKNTGQKAAAIREYEFILKEFDPTNEEILSALEELRSK